MGRDDFTIKTKELVAKRVAYRCCYKGCGIATIGPRNGDKLNTSNIGVACHIYAASPKGPRYKADMTTKERKSSDNCIWMCQNHAKIIDTDKDAYPPELLFQWKAEAEHEAAEKLKEYRYSQSELEDKQTLENILKKLIQEGQYDTLIILIDRIKATNPSDEMLLRYEIIYRCYCNIAELPIYIKTYLSTITEKQCDSIIRVMVSLNLKTGLQELLPYCQDNELKIWAMAILNGTLDHTLFRPIEQIDNESEIEVKDNETASKLLSSYIIDNGIPVLPLSASGATFVMYENEFIFKIRACSWRVLCETVNNKYFVKDQRMNENYIFLKNSFKNIMQLDKNWQIYIWTSCLNYVIHDKDEFEQIYKICPDYIKTDIKCKRVYVCFDLLHNNKDPKEYFKDYDIVNDDRTLALILQHINDEAKYRFLKNHQYLFERNSIFIFLWSQNSKISNQEKYATLLEYKEYYSNDLMWHIMVAYFADVKDGIVYLKWAKEHEQEIKSNTIDLYIETLKRYEDWDALKGLFTHVANDDFRYSIVLALCANNSIENNLYCLKLFKQMEEKGFYSKWFYQNFALLLFRTGDLVAAKDYYEKEFANNPDNKVLIELLRVKLLCNDFNIDKYVEIAGKEDDEDLQYMAATFYGKNNEYDLEKKYLIRSLLKNPNKLEALTSLAAVYSTHPDEDKFKFGRAYKLENQQEYLYIAIVSDDLIANISYQPILGYEIVAKESNPQFISWEFLDTNESVTFEDRSYTVTEIVSFSEKLYYLAFEFSQKNSKIKQINLESPQEAIKEISEILEEQTKEREEIFNIFNSSNGVFPITLLVKRVGLSYYNVWGHIISKNELKINNYSRYKCENYVLSHDAICTLGALGAIRDIDISSIVIAKQTKIDIKSMFTSEINELQDGAIGALFYKNGQIYRTDYDNNYKKYVTAFFGELSDFVNKIKELDTRSFISKHEEITNFFIQNDLVSERYTLGLAQNNSQFAIICDEPFICNICEIENIPHISTIDFLFSQNLNHDDILNYLKMLDSFTFAHYFNAKVYKKIIDSVNKIGDDERTEFLSEFQKWLVPTKRSKAHSYMVFNTFQELLAEDAQSIYSRSLANIGMFYFSELFPEKYNELINQLKNMVWGYVPFDDENS